MVVQLLQLSGGQSYFLNLGGDDWTATGSSPPSTVITRIPKATVPGCIHTDWYKHIGPDTEHNPFYRFNDDKWRNIADKNWEYEKTFSVDGTLMKHKEQWLVCEGLDTIANVSLNSRPLGTARNMFIRHFFNITGILQNYFNSIRISFESATRYANKSRSTLKYPIPPECPPDVQHGFCHVNLIRKEQSSFSWDWGPGFATQGIWKPIYLVGIEQVLLTDISISYNWDSEDLSIDVRFLVAGSVQNASGTISLFVDELSILNVSHAVAINSKNPSTNILQKIPQKTIKLWWPNGQGEQKLYNITVEFNTDDLEDHFSKTIWFGFRKVDLVQAPIHGSAGLSFYLKINDRPIFAKGSNWIPADAFPTRASSDNYTNLLQSAKDANMNILRVWGGGIYESDEFYELADSMGIMIWHDFMFACAMYPSDAKFLESVSQEVGDALWRLKSHPSIILWAGNNENEAALATNWYNTSSKFELYRRDYIMLYVDTIGKVVAGLDSTRPFLTSSPTNGYESTQEDWVAKNPYDTHYGDTHYYNYDIDCMDWKKFPKTRFASEYGYQSFSSVQTMLAVSVPTDLTWNSTFILQRNHHSDGNNQILRQILKHFNISVAESGEKYFANLVYLSQIMQGLCYKSETEFYRRSRSEVVHGEGHTMGALYWQLNDVWQTTSWSSIEYGGKWKVVQYLARKFFANTALSAYDDGDFLNVYSISDILIPLNSVTLVIEMNMWGEFGVKHQWNLPVDLTPQSSTLLYRENIDTMMRNASCKEKEKCYFVIFIEEIPDVPETYFYPVSFKNIVGMKKPRIQIEDVTLLHSKSSRVVMEEYRVSLASDFPAFFVFLETNDITGRFSDNAFHLNTKKTTVIFYAWQMTTASAVKSSIRIKSLAEASLGAGNIYGTYAVYKNQPDPFSRTAIDHEGLTIWLDDVEAKLAFGLCGMLFLMFFAVLLVCVIMRFNPHLSKAGTLITRPEQQKHPAPISRQADEIIDPDESSAAFLLNLHDQSTPSKRGVDVMFYIR